MLKQKSIQPLTGRWRSLQQHPKRLWLLSIGWLLLISSIAFLWNLGSIGLVDKTEPMFVEAARQMVLTGDWITPYWNGETRFDKPPLVYWLMAIAFKIFGINEGAARLPSALAAIALVVLGFYTLRYFGFPNPSDQGVKDKSNLQQRQLWASAWIGSAIIAFNPAWIAWGRTGVSDMLLAACMSLALLSFFLGYAQPEKAQQKAGMFSVQQQWYLGFYVFAALAVLAKGPVGIVLPVMIIAAFLLYVGKWREVLREMRILRGSAIFLAIAVPWFVLVTLANGQAYIDNFFGYHNLQRFTSVVSHHPGPWYYYIPVILVGLIPWSIYLPAAIARLRFWRRDRWQSAPRSHHLGIFALFWLAVIVVFFSISVTKLPSYVLPSMPASAILVTLWWTNELGKTQRSSRHFWVFLISAIINVAILAALAIASFYSPKIIGYDPTMPEWRQVLQASGVPIRSAIIWALAALAAVWLLGRQRTWRWLWIPNLVSFMAFISLAALPAAQLMDSQRQLPLRQLAERVRQVRQPQEELLMLGFLRPSLVFYTQQTVQFFYDTEPAIDYLKDEGDANGKPPTLLILSQPKYIAKLGLQPQDYQLLDQRGAYQLIRVTRQTLVGSRESGVRN
jgi:4-amino-4-deoxy-L-arabinose transferase-like glycosyltransferase